MNCDPSGDWGAGPGGSLYSWNSFLFLCLVRVNVIRKGTPGISKLICLIPKNHLEKNISCLTDFVIINYVNDCLNDWLVDSLIDYFIDSFNK